jgi:hypothetical protein
MSGTRIPASVQTFISMTKSRSARRVRRIILVSVVIEFTNERAEMGFEVLIGLREYE